MIVNVLFIGDVFGKPGREILHKHLKHIKKEFKIDLCIANLENLSDGKGITENEAKKCFSYGVDLATGGNHIWDRLESHEYLEKERRICCPLNKPTPKIGRRYAQTSIKGFKINVVNLLGQVYMNPTDSPFEAIDKFVQDHSDEVTIVDFHAEATGEKRALAWFLDGRVSAVIGTHTHIQTADEEILPHSTAYLTDVGMTGPHNSVIGVTKSSILSKMVEGIHKVQFCAQEGLQLNAVVLTINLENKETLKIQRIRRCFDE